MGLSLRKLGSRILDQVNPLDNGRTFQQRTPTNNRSVAGQLTHNGLTNTVGNMTVKPVMAAPLAQSIAHGRQGFTDSFNKIGQSYKPVRTSDGNLQYNEAIGATTMGSLRSPIRVKAPVVALKPTPIPVTVKPGPRATTVPVKVIKKIPVRSIPSDDVLHTRYNEHLAASSKKWGQEQHQATLAGRKGRQAIDSEQSVYADVAHAAERQKIDQMYKDGTLPKIIPVKDGVASKHEIKLKKLEAVKAPTKGQLIEEALLREKTGRPAFEAGKPPVTPPVTGPSIRPYKLTGQIPSKLRAPKFSTAEVAGREDPRLHEGMLARSEYHHQMRGIARSHIDRAVAGLSEEEVTNMARVLKGTEKPVNAKVAEAAKQSKAIFDRFGNFIEAVGLKGPNGLRENYFPQYVHPKTYKVGTKENLAAVDHLVKTGQATDAVEAADLLRQHQALYNGPRYSKPNSNLKSRSLDLPTYPESVEAMHTYADRMSAAIAQAHVFGAKSEVLDQIWKDIEKNGGKVSKAQKAYRQGSNLEIGSDWGEKLSRAATTVQGATKLGLSTIGNVTQRANNATVGGIDRAAKAQWSQHFNKADKEFVGKTGVMDEQVAQEALFGEQGLQSKYSDYTAPGFRQVEQGNRANAAITGRNQARDLAQKAASGDKKAADRLWNDFGIRPETVKNGSLSGAQEIRAARAFVRRTQFDTTNTFLPGWATTPLGRVISQFRRYPFMQATFLKREIGDELRQGNAAPLVRHLAIGAPTGIASQAATGAIRGVGGQDQSGPEKALDLLNDATGSSLVTSLPQSLYPNSYDSNSYTTKVVKGLGGATVSDATKLIQGGWDLAKKGNPTNAERFALQHVPVVGTPLAARVLPYKGGTDKPVDPNKKDLTIDEMNTKAKQETADFKKNMKPDGQGLTKLSDGTYLYQVGNDTGTAKDLRTAQDKVARYNFDKSDAQSKVVHDTYYYKNGQGKTESMPEQQHQYNIKDSKNSLEMDSTYRAGDWEGWQKVAQSQWQVLEDKKKYYNPDSQQDKIDDLTNRQNDLQYKMDNYAEKIAEGKGFGGKGGSGSGSGVGSSLKYAISLSAGGKAANATKAPVKVGELRKSKVGSKAGVGKPKVTSKKALT